MHSIIFITFDTIAQLYQSPAINFVLHFTFSDGERQATLFETIKLPSERKILLPFFGPK